MFPTALKQDIKHWYENSQFYHVYPLGQLGALQSHYPQKLTSLIDWIPHWQDLGITALYLGPLFQSHYHGYDTLDFRQVDSRLGTNQDLKDLVEALHTAGIKVVLDGVFNHVGRQFFAFQDVCQKGQNSEYVDWFHLDFEAQSSHGDPFDYLDWEGHSELVKLNHQNPQVRAYLYGSIQKWVHEFQIDGLRLDVAYSLDPQFLKELAAMCRQSKPHFWLLGEVIHGDHRPWLEILDATTNYECYKGLYSSHNDHNYFEIAYSLNRLFGKEGIYRGRYLYNFVDNHDVNRISSQLNTPQHLFPLHILLMTLPGIPSIYYGSEWGLQGEKVDGRDEALRPAISAEAAQSSAQHSELYKLIRQLAHLRLRESSLRHGDYQQVLVRHKQFGFARSTPEQLSLVLVNMSSHPKKVSLQDLPGEGPYQDILNPGGYFNLSHHHREVELPAYGGRILVHRKRA